MYIELYLKVAIVFLLIQNKKPMPWDFSEKKNKTSNIRNVQHRSMHSYTYQIYIYIYIINRK